MYSDVLGRGSSGGVRRYGKSHYAMLRIFLVVNSVHVHSRKLVYVSAESVADCFLFEMVLERMCFMITVK